MRHQLVLVVVAVVALLPFSKAQPPDSPYFSPVATPTTAPTKTSTSSSASKPSVSESSCEGYQTDTCLMPGDFGSSPSCEVKSPLSTCESQKWGVSFVTWSFDQTKKQTTYVYNMSSPDASSAFRGVIMGWKGNCCVTGSDYPGIMPTYSSNPDSITCLYGIKFSGGLPSGSNSGIYNYTVAGRIPPSEGGSTVSFYTDMGYCSYEMPGPDCNECSAGGTADASPIAASMPASPSATEDKTSTSGPTVAPVDDAKAPPADASPVTPNFSPVAATSGPTVAPVDDAKAPPADAYAVTPNFSPVAETTAPARTTASPVISTDLAPSDSESSDSDNSSPASTSTDAPTEAPAEAPTIENAEGPTKAPAEGTTKAPTKEPAEGTTKAPTEVPAEGTTKAPTEEPAEAPAEAPTKAADTTETSSPSISPVAAGSPVEGAAQSPCEDNEEYSFWVDLTIGSHECKWLTGEGSEFKDLLCTVTEIPYYLCPKSCGRCK